MTDSPPSERSAQTRVPDELIWPKEFFAESFQARVDEGLEHLRQSRVAFVGLARNCGAWLDRNLRRLEILVGHCGSWLLHIESNDNADNTTDVLAAFCRRHHQASYRYQSLNRRQFAAEFAGPRTIALAEYRTACQQWVRCHARDADYVVAIDFDAWGGWSHAGVMNSVGWLLALPGAYGMAAVSVFEHPAWVTDGKGATQMVPQWLHYDAWALRGVGQSENYWDDYTAGHGGWKHQWLPPVGSPPVLVSSAFGGMCIYRAEAYRAGMYDGAADCEHVPFHRSIREATGQHLYICPGLRTVMRWLDATR